MVGRSESVRTQMHGNSPYFGSSGIAKAECFATLLHSDLISSDFLFFDFLFSDASISACHLSILSEVCLLNVLRVDMSYEFDCHGKFGATMSMIQGRSFLLELSLQQQAFFFLDSGWYDYKWGRKPNHPKNMWTRGMNIHIYIHE